MSSKSDPEQVAILAGAQVVNGLSLLAAASVALTAMSAGCGYFLYFGYLVTVGAPWFKDVLPATLLVQAGAPFVMSLALVALIALLLHARGVSLPKLRYVVSGWFFLMLLCAIAIRFFGVSDAPFLMQFGTALAFAVVLPAWVLRMARSWSGRRIVVVPILINVIGAGSIIPLLFGISRGFIERESPEILSEVELLEGAENGGDWRLLVVTDGGVLITKLTGNSAFKEYKIIQPEQVLRIHSTRVGAPWAPAQSR